MFKLLLSGVAILLVSLTGNTQAQQSPGSTTTTPQSQTGSFTPTPLKATDLPLLTRAIGKFWQTDRAETESQMEIDSSDEKDKTKYFVSIRSIAKVGRKFRSELTVSQGEQTVKIKYTVVSDGSKVWIYRPDLRQYAQVSSNGFYNSPSCLIASIFSLTTSALADPQRQDLITDILGGNDRILSLETLQELQVYRQRIDGQNLVIYEYGPSYSNISGFVNPQTGMFERMESKLGDKQTRTEIVEKLIKRNPQVLITDRTFTFSPPKGAKKVKSLQIGPFKF
jgi:outer membrane lipoprotein-sorting protein